MPELTRSYAESNVELAESFRRYMEARGLSQNTVKSYRTAITGFVEQFGSASVIEAKRSDIHTFLGSLLRRGLGDNAVNSRTQALRCFFKFLLLAGLIRLNPMLQVSHRKIPKRLPRLLTIEEVEKLIAAARNPFEKAATEFLYATGIRVSEFCALRLEDVNLAEHTVKVVQGKGGKDRYSLFGSHAAKAIEEYIAWRKPVEFLFETTVRDGTSSIERTAKGWRTRAYFNAVQRNVYLGKQRDVPTEEAAREVFKRITERIPGYHPTGGHAYNVRAIHGMLDGLSHRANIGHVHPHSLRRAAACHLLTSGAGIREVQTFLGHSQLRTTQIYTTLTNEKLDEIYRKAHPHA